MNKDDEIQETVAQKKNNNKSLDRLKSYVDLYEKRKISDDILKDIKYYKQFEVCPNCNGKKIFEEAVICSKEEMEWTNDGKYFCIDTYNCHKCYGLGFLKNSEEIKKERNV